MSRAEAIRAADEAAGIRSAYVHVPFCARVCPYCDFAVVAGADHLADRYADALVAEIEQREPWDRLGAVFVGGGTPSRFGADRLARVIGALRARLGLEDGAEVTLEANPEDWSEELASQLQGAGFTRVSFGAQSFTPRVLVALGRRHDAGQISAAVTGARSAGFGSVSLDLIFGTPGETLEDWKRSVGRALDLGPDHMSCYALTVERGTPLGRAVARGAPAPDGDLAADQYEWAAERLATAGLERYEVSNWAKPGHECVYNLSVWGQGEFEAFGNGAHGYRHGERYRNVRRLETYLDRVESGANPRAGSDVMDPWDTELDRLFVGLRRTAGVADGPGVEAFVESPEGARLMGAAIVEFVDGWLRVVQPLLTDEVERVVLDLVPPKSPNGGLRNSSPP